MLSPSPSQRLGSLDTYRGLVMVALASRGFGIAATANNFPESSVWQTLGDQFEHVPWVGCGFWDLIQPSFMFMVGVSLPFSYARRFAEGQPMIKLGLHAAMRAVLLVFLGVFLASQSGSRPNYEFFNVLAQIGLGYIFLFLLWNRPAWLQLLVAQVILVAYWAWFAFTPVGDASLLASVGVPEDWPHKLTGFAAHWQMNSNPASRFDVWFLNLFPRNSRLCSTGADTRR